MPAVEVRDLSKRFGRLHAVRGLSFDVQAGRVTGFLGPNGAGKSTTLRALLGLIRPTGGSATFGGVRYEELPDPTRQVGVVLEDTAFHPGRTARNHLRVLAVAGEHPPERVDAVLAQVGLTDAADRRVKGFSMGMRQRLAIAGALLGEPKILILDEPANGLDPPGISWMRGLMRDQAARGNAVLVSSHLLAEVAQSVDDVVVVAKGELRGHGTLEEVLGGGEDGVATEVRSLDPERLASVLASRGFAVERSDSMLLVRDASTEDVGRAAADERVVLTGLAPRSRSLEAAFFDLTKDSE